MDNSSTNTFEIDTRLSYLAVCLGSRTRYRLTSTWHDDIMASIILKQPNIQ